MFEFFFFMLGAMCAAVVFGIDAAMTGRGKKSEPAEPAEPAKPAKSVQPSTMVLVRADTPEAAAVHLSIVRGETVLMRVRPLKVVTTYDGDGDAQTGMVEFYVFDVMEDDGRDE